MDHNLARYATIIRDKLEDILEKEKHFFKENSFAQDLFDRLKTFVKSGKIWRGSIIALTSEIFTGKISEEAIGAGCAAEMFQAALLIHDDIIDKDYLRRGKKTIFAQYQDKGKENNFADQVHFGYSIGICAGDVCIALAYKILNELKIDDSKKFEIIKEFSNTLISTGFGEMDDVFTGFLSKEITCERIMSIYKNKTALYTFSTPLVIGAILGEIDVKDREKLISLGIDLGIIFQIKDDELGIFGSEEKIGKPVGGDFIENKKTLHRYFLFSKASKEDREKLEKLFGNENITNADMEFVKTKMAQYNIGELVNKEIDRYELEVREKINNLGLNGKFKEFLNGVLETSLNRIS